MFKKRALFTSILLTTITLSAFSSPFSGQIPRMSPKSPANYFKNSLVIKFPNSAVTTANFQQNLRGIQEAIHEETSPNDPILIVKHNCTSEKCGYSVCRALMRQGVRLAGIQFVQPPTTAQAQQGCNNARKPHFNPGHLPIESNPVSNKFEGTADYQTVAD